MTTSAASLWARVGECMRFDRPRISALLRGAERRGSVEALAEVAREIERSAGVRAERARRLPKPEFPSELPVVQRRSEIAAAIAGHQVVVVCGETGSGKTTQLPKICLELGRGVEGAIGHTQPRRIAARSVAARVAEELGTPLGQSVGFKVRFHDRVSDHTLVKLMTDGILLAETQGDRDLLRYDTLIIDEAHERSLNIDFLLGYLKQLLPRRPDLKVIVTSATIDPKSFSEHFGGPSKCPVIEVSGRTYPVEVRYRPPPPGEDGEPGDLEDAILAAVDELAKESDRGDVLVFLPGEREIRETAEALRKHHPRGFEVLPLYARLAADEQNRVFEAHQRRRIVLSTNVAETSLTVPGIRYVIDSGVARISRYSPRLKVQRLPVEAISRASANQRSGRCGRVEAGIAVRLYDESDFTARSEFTDPEILRTNLASVILQMKALGLGKIEDFPFLLPPETGLVRDGYDTLRELGAVDDRGELTAIGGKLAKLPIDPRLGRMVVEAERLRCLGEVLVLAAALSVQDPRERPLDKQEAADLAHELWKDEDSDFLALLKLFRAFIAERERLSHSKLRKWCAERFVSYTRMREWVDIHQQLHTMAADMGLHADNRPVAYEPLHRALLTGLLSSVARKSEGAGALPGEYDGPRGMKLSIHPGSGLFRSGAKWIVAAELVRTTRLYARTVAKVRPEWLEEPAAHLVKRTYAEPHWAPETAQVNAYETVNLFGLDIVKRRRVHYGPVDPAVSRTLFIQHALVQGEYLTPGRFFESNFALQKRVQQMEDKVRARDLLADTGQRFRFYDQRVPAGVFTGPAFEAWRRKAEAKEPGLLVMTPADIMQSGAVEPEAVKFPDAQIFETLRLPLSYKLDQAAADDGITATIRLGDVHELDGRSFEWLVPGRLAEKLASLVKTLPKNVRTSLGAAKQVGDAAAKALAFGDGDLFEQFAAYIRKTTALSVQPGDFRPDQVEPHLRMNFRVLDESGKVVAEGRDLAAIQLELRKRVAEAIRRLPAGPFNRAGITAWDFGDLPEHLGARANGQAVRVYPALTDERGVVAIRPFDDPARAAEAMRGGLTRLLMLQVRPQIRSLVTTMPGIERLTLLHATVGPGELLIEDLSELTAWRAFFADGTGVRTKAQFERRLDEGWAKLGAAGREAFDLAERVFTARQVAAARLAGLPAGWHVAGGAAIAADVKLQLALLVPRRALALTPWRWLQQIPRYLAAVNRRLEKAVGEGLERDARNMAEVTRFMKPLVEAAGPALASGSGALPPALAEYRWMVEEYRVSLFAQDLKTSVPVSALRLERLWARAQGEALVARVMGA